MSGGRPGQSGYTEGKCPSSLSAGPAALWLSRPGACMTFRSPSPFRAPPRPSSWRLRSGLTGCLALFAGCDDPTGIRPGDVRVYEAAKEPMAADQPSGSQPAAEPKPEGGLALRYDPPPGWTDRGASGMRLASLAIGEPSDGHEVTVIPASGSLEANVSRWIGQLDSGAAEATLAERTKAALAAAETVEVDGTKVTIVLLASGSETDDADEAILGAAIPLDDTASLFVKFKGPAKVARRERDNFVRFVSSIRWK